MVAVLAMVALITTGVDAGLVGLVLSYAMNATSSLVGDVLAALSSGSNSFDRIGWLDPQVMLSKT
jgi:hypothetical protein